MVEIQRLVDQQPSRLSDRVSARVADRNIPQAQAISTGQQFQQQKQKMQYNAAVRMFQQQEQRKAALYQDYQNFLPTYEKEKQEYYDTLVNVTPQEKMQKEKTDYEIALKQFEQKTKELTALDNNKAIAENWTIAQEQSKSLSDIEQNYYLSTEEQSKVSALTDEFKEFQSTPFGIIRGANLGTYSVAIRPTGDKSFAAFNQYIGSGEYQVYNPNTNAVEYHQRDVQMVRYGFADWRPRLVSDVVTRKVAVGEGLSSRGKYELQTNLSKIDIPINTVLSDLNKSFNENVSYYANKQMNIAYQKRIEEGKIKTTVPKIVAVKPVAGGQVTWNNLGKKSFTPTTLNKTVKLNLKF